jgi:alkylation response protein AidB-like acyl-CoA dehydrogenase
MLVVDMAASTRFDLSESHTLLRQTVRDFCEREVLPKAGEWDEAERFPSEIVPRLADMGLLGIRIPEAYGGAGMDTLAYAIVVEEVARVDGSLALTVASHNGLGTSHILSFGTEAHRGRVPGRDVEARRCGTPSGSCPPTANCL